MRRPKLKPLSEAEVAQRLRPPRRVLVMLGATGLAPGWKGGRDGQLVEMLREEDRPLLHKAADRIEELTDGSNA